MILQRLARSLAPAILLCATIAGAADSIAEPDRQKILAAFPELSADAISPSPIPGLYEIMLGGQVSYVSADGGYLLQGDLFDVEREINLTESRRALARKAAIDSVSESSTIVFRPTAKKFSVTVFTDIDCGYCRKLHRQIADYNALGIQVRYLFFPRSGPDTESWFKADNVWCAADRNEALTRAKSGAVIASGDCGTTPVSQHYKLGRSLGIRGTPAIVTQTGELIPGYVSPGELLEYLQD